MGDLMTISRTSLSLGCLCWDFGHPKDGGMPHCLTLHLLMLMLMLKCIETDACNRALYKNQ